MQHGIELLKEGLQTLNLEITQDQVEQFLTFYDMMIETNQVMNLTAITDFDEVIVKHFLDSLLIVKEIDLKTIHTMIDVGTGAGFPGIPIKIMFPHIEMVLLDSLQKRLKFLEQVITSLNLTGMQTVHGRAEDIAGKAEYREQNDVCVSRAVANLSTLSEYCIPFVKPGGMFISYKAAASDEEILNAENAIKVLGGKLVKQRTIQLPGSEINRNFVCIKKVGNTPKKYPRKAGTPSKNPL